MLTCMTIQVADGVGLIPQGLGCGYILYMMKCVYELPGHEVT